MGKSTARTICPQERVRLGQPTNGYAAVIESGESTRRDDAPVGALRGRRLRNAALVVDPARSMDWERTVQKRHPMIPVAPPRAVNAVYSDHEIGRLVNVLRTRGPWRLITGIYYKTVEELLQVVMPTGAPEDVRLEDFVKPAFRGFFGNNGMAYEQEIHDIFYSKKLLDMVKVMYGAQYGAPFLYQFNMLAPLRSYDHGHFDGGSWRGMDPTNTPSWVMSIMGKSGLFDRWRVKAGQVLTWFYPSNVDGGFTYWPDGPSRPPKRLVPPFWNNGIVSDNQCMFHRAESNGPLDRRDSPEGLAIHSMLQSDDPDGWTVTTDGNPVARYRNDEMRLLFHYDAHVFDDLADVKRHHDHTDDLNRDMVFEMLVADLRRRGVQFETPTDPINDPTFMGVLTKTYHLSPTSYPHDAQPEQIRRAA